MKKDNILAVGMLVGLVVGLMASDLSFLGALIVSMLAIQIASAWAKKDLGRQIKDGWKEMFILPTLIIAVLGGMTTFLDYAMAGIAVVIAAYLDCKIGGLLRRNFRKEERPKHQKKVQLNVTLDNLQGSNEIDLVKRICVERSGRAGMTY